MPTPAEVAILSRLALIKYKIILITATAIRYDLN